MGRRNEWKFSQRRHEDGQQTHEKILNITNHQENAHQNTRRYYFTPVRMAVIKKKIRNEYWQGNVEKATLVRCW